MAYTLALTMVNMYTQELCPVLIVASNGFMLNIKANNIINSERCVTDWYLASSKWNAGNSGLNAEPYLWETLEELNIN